MSYVEDIEFTKYFSSREINSSFLNDLALIPSYYTISISDIGDEEEEYLSKMRNLLERLLELDKHNEVIFPFSSFYLMDKNLLNNVLMRYPNATLIHSSLRSKFTSEEYLNFYHELTNFLKPIILKDRKEKLSPLELFTLIYQKVVNFREYTSYPNDYPLEFDALKNLFSSPYFVCRDYVKLLVCTLSYMGINSSMTRVDIEEWKKDELTILYHARALIRLVDPKYKIDGFYLSDPTFDQEENFSHALMTFRDTTIENELQRLSLLDLFFDVKSMDEFRVKMTKLLHKVKNPVKIYFLFLKEIKPLDFTLYHYLYQKYGKYRTQDFPYLDFLEEIGKYIVRKTNQDILSSTLVDAYMRSRYGDNLLYDNVKKLERLKKENALAKNHFFWDFWQYDMDHKRIK